MPSKSQAQHNLMAMVAHNPAMARKLHISADVGREFIAADKASGKFRGGMKHKRRKK